MAKIEECKCGSKDIVITPKHKGEDVATASMVAIKCKSCGRWLGWCSKEDRDKYPAEECKEEEVTETKIEEPKKVVHSSGKIGKAEEIRADFLNCTKESAIVGRATALEYIDKVIALFKN